MKNKNLIIFDFFGVISNELSPKWFNNHFDKNEAKILKDKYFIPADNGLYTIEETINKIAKDYNFNYDDIINEFRSNAILNIDLLNYILKLKKDNYVALLSNAAKNIFKLFFPNLDFNKYFDNYFISCEYGISKPNLKFYELCINSFNIKFDNIYMIDDNIINIKDLNQININGILYKNLDDLKNKLNNI